ncbi:hypothetical protein ISF_06790 [Cordyceps fumosorosea ARSEF 2679]|uniref:Uncharacterized protein n=1 Tax=Cordyceps fumosorosea (strain ARSEF 2679) TaxID=1081104 RepID=A0A167R405_CORFA|nr:hypothetical protein ISF_06790 [Cordyceps fumosorosea ARSEF 2679]OAA58251.1 hypothetical protein ISF_06790 [Cordyceps fumosorosea ARSEF 2679]
MVLPEKLVGLGLGFSSLMSPTDGVSHKALRLRDLGDLAGSSTTDLVRFSGTLKVARGIVEDHRRSETIEVPTSGLVSILNRIKALEKEVQDMIDGKRVSENSKAVKSPPSSSASGGSASSSSSAVSSGGGSGGGSGSNAGSSDSGGGKSVSNHGSKSDSGNSGSASSGSSSSPPSATVSGAAGSSGGSSDGKDDCAPEHLLYRLGGASLEHRSMTSVSVHHPLFRRTTNCTLDSVSGGGSGGSGGGDGKKESSALPSGAAVFKETSSSGAADDSATDSTGSPAADTFALPAAATAGPGSKAKGSPESDDHAADTTVTTTMTSTSYMTVTVRLRPFVSITAAGSPGKYSNSPSIPDPAGHRFSNATTALATESETTTPSPASALPGKNRIFAQTNDTTAAVEAPSASSSSPVGSGPSALSSDSPSRLSTGSASNSSATDEAATTPSSMGAEGGDDTSDAVDSEALLAPNHQKNLTLASATAVVDTPTPAVPSSSIPSPEPSGPSLPQNTTTTTVPAGTPPISGLSSAPSLPDDGAASLTGTNSSAIAPENAAVSGNSPAKKTTSTITSTLSITVPAGGRSTDAADPEATTASSSDVVAAPVNGTLEKRQSGFRTVRSLRRRTAAAVEHD